MQATPERSVRARPRKPKILVVDDEVDNLELLYRTFYREYRVLQAESGPDALEILAREPDIAAIVSDQRMPMMSGTEFLSLTAVQYPDIMRIILTGYTDVEDLVEAINSGKVFRYVTKPWEPEALKEVVRQAIETHNVLKKRTEGLRRSLRRESLLNRIMNTIRNAQYGSSGESPLREVLQTIVDSLGQVLEIDSCILRPFDGEQLTPEVFIHQNQANDGKAESGAKEPKWEHTVWETHQIEVIDDVARSDRVVEKAAVAFAEANIASTLIVPLLFQTQLVAVLGLHHCGSPQAWEDDDIQLAVMVADQAALAISQARAYEQVQTLAQRETLVNTITNAIRSSLEPQEIFSAIAEQLGRSLEVDGCTLSLWTEEDELMRCVALYERDSPLPDDMPQSQVPIASNPVLQQLMRDRYPVVLSDLESAAEMKGGDLPLRLPARALLVVPLLVDGEIIGSISLRQSRSPRQWLTSEIELARAIASQAAIAVQQSNLYQTTREQAERLLELNRQKTEFFQNISHELRTPLTLTIGPLESAVARSQGLSLESSLIALRNSRRLLRLVNQLLDLQRLDAGRMQATFRPCNLGHFIEQITASFKSYCEKKHLILQTDLQSCPPVYLDLEKFDKVIYNLLSNAMKFTPPGGKITIAVAPQGEGVCLQVRDTGIGIAAAQIPQLFQRFRQAEGSISRSYEGTGLGLAMVKEMVDLHGGKVSIESVQSDETHSELPHGTTCSVWLPCGKAHLASERVVEEVLEVETARAAVELADLEAELLDLEQDEAMAASNSPETSTLSAASAALPLLLVVEDNPDMRAYVCEILVRENYRVCTARNGEEGWQVLQERRPQLIVTDLMMPKVSGLDLIRLTREDPELKGTPIILLTAKADDESRVAGTEKGADAYLAKPFNDRELLAEVRNLLSLKENEQRIKQLNEYLTESVLSRFLPQEMVQRAAAGELALDLQPEPRVVTMLFSDIVGFTPLSNTLQSHRIAPLLNEYLEAMTEEIFAAGGTVDKFVGDAIVALFGAPEELSPQEQVRRAVTAARRMLLRLEALNQRWQEGGLLGGEGPPLLQFRCGIHQGPVVVGMFGSHQRSDYTAIGPAVNLASRLQEVTQPNTILISAVVAEFLGENETIALGPLKLKGLEEEILTFLVRS
ncbi:response regulator [Oscillatoria sp. FACHB-1406]|uniref:response regulator n=1 Tax=Oscillatoria sp. FACHB-1406 TaxID=2692846 RepID=UPI001684D3EC|nr:response regulator [Oscillatoria sp. FACHB-1406]MBD2577812.1 response regulator [Oscillatoria sp. FACHB-1406]